MPQEFGCEDFQLLYTADNGHVGSEVSFILKNNMKNTIILNRTYITYNVYTPTVNGWETRCGVYPEPSGGLYEGSTPDDWPSLNPGEKIEVECNPGSAAFIKFPLVGEKEKVTFSFTYKLTQDGFAHRIDGEIIAVVQTP